MDIKDVRLRKGMSRDEVNELIGQWLTFEDDVYLRNNYKHHWRCKCGNLFERRYADIKRRSNIDCGCIEYNKTEQRYEYEVEKDGEYEYIRSYRRGDVLPNIGIINQPYIQVRHKYCGSLYEIIPRRFINENQRCSNCCGSYENSFAYHIEVELGESLDKYWDFEKNTVNPYHISKGMNAKNSKGENTKVWIKCTEKDYHGSYEISCSHFTRGQRCGQCGSHKIHPKDSFAQYHIDNTDKDFLTKYWSDKNTINPWSISPSSGIKVWIKCQDKDYHDDYEIGCNIFTKGVRCGYCASQKVHPLDSFGYHNFDKAQSWHPDNKISPFRVSPNSGKKYKFICPDCDYVWDVMISGISRGTWCPQCNSSKGEKRINSWLKLNNINFTPQKTFNKLLGLGGKNLSYDFYLPDYNLLIEYQGEFHDGNVRNQTERKLERQKEHDRRKRNYAKRNNINLLEIWYWDFDNIEKILKKELNI